MAVIGHRLRTAAVLMVLVAASGAQMCADDSAEIHQVIGSVATALSNGDAALAISSFSKAYAGYDKLNDDFEALSGAFYVESQLEFTDEDLSVSAATVAVHWAMTLTTRQSGFTTNRNADINLKLARDGKHWRIVEFGPIGIFEP